jgi:hypothetical protein
MTDERIKTVTFLRETAKFWRTQAVRLHRADIVVRIYEAKANVLEDAAKDIEHECHLTEHPCGSAS